MPSSEITTLSELQEYLYLAMQLEHATLPAYLTALYSIKPGTNSDAVHIIRVVAVEEMLHLTIAANLLNAIGGTPDLTRAGFVPSYPTYLPDGEKDFQVHVARFSRDTIETFKQIERPRLASKGQDKLVRRSYEPGTSVLGARPGATDMHYYSIGDFYAAIEEGFVVLEGQAKVTRGKRKVGEVLPGEFFGELSLIDGGPRSASVIADTPMRVLRVFRRTLTGLWRDEPNLAIRVLDGMVRRVREVSRHTNG